MTTSPVAVCFGWVALTNHWGTASLRRSNRCAPTRDQKWGVFVILDIARAARADTSGTNRSWTRSPGCLGLSLADRACLALGRVTGHTVLTGERDWLQVDLGVTVRHIRPQTAG